jgi:hypothetical protein
MCGPISFRTLLSVLVLGISLPAQSPPIDTVRAPERIYVGVLDDAREEMLNWKPGVSQQRVIRPAFEKTAEGWKQVEQSSFPTHIKWTIAFDGKKLGEAESQAGSKDGLTPVQTILNANAVPPPVGSPSQQFAGLMADGPTKVRRPLVAVSNPYFRDPDGWKRAKLPDDIADLVRGTFRREYPHVDRCKEEQVVESNWKFPDSALELPVVYASNKHSFLVQADLNTEECGWVDQSNDPQSKPWFFVSTDKIVRHIGSFMTLLDAGDYDNDGKSEVIFFLSQGENTDGFILFDASFEKQASLLWHYH